MLPVIDDRQHDTRRAHAQLRTSCSRDQPAGVAARPPYGVGQQRLHALGDRIPHWLGPSRRAACSVPATSL